MMPRTKVARPRAADYPIIIQWSDRDQTFMVTIPDLPGCMVDGPTPEEAAREAHIAMQLWLDVSYDNGDPIPKPSRFPFVPTVAA